MSDGSAFKRPLSDHEDPHGAFASLESETIPQYAGRLRI